MDLHGSGCKKQHQVYYLTLRGHNHHVYETGILSVIAGLDPTNMADVFGLFQTVARQKWQDAKEIPGVWTQKFGKIGKI